MHLAFDPSKEETIKWKGVFKKKIDQVKGYYHRKNVPSETTCGHRCVAVAYLSSASANYLPDSELR